MQQRQKEQLKSLKNKTLLITGGTGSFGNAVLNRFLSTDIKEIRIFSRDEKKQDDMRRQYNNLKIKFYIGDIRDMCSIKDAIQGVDIIFHAAALKQVPSCEFFPIQAVKTNILGTNNILTLAEKHEVRNVIILSTDKAVYPINAMGMSKALMEKVMIAKVRNNKDGQVFCGTRYGNVMCTRGSVIPLFIEQIKQNKPITITNPLMTRFMMTMDHAINLVFYALQNANPGDIFVQKSPSATLHTLAESLIELYKSKSEIIYIGERHGEKLHETLVSREEMIKAEDLGEYFKIPADSRDLNYEQYFSKGKQIVSEIKKYTSQNTEILDIEKLKTLLLTIPEIKADV
jgi:UDP-glucose 4-epimerase